MVSIVEPFYARGAILTIGSKLELSEAERPKIDPDFEEVTEGEEVDIAAPHFGHEASIDIRWLPSVTVGCV